MRAFKDIYAQAADRKGGEAALEALVAGHKPRSPAELAAIGDDRWLAQMSKCVFQAGFSWKVIDAKWPGFEVAFHGFGPPINAAMSDEDFDGPLEVTKKRASRLSGETAMRPFRFMGKPSFITSRDVSAALATAGVIQGPVKGGKDIRKVQEAFNAWARESGRDLTTISRVLALSTGPEAPFPSGR